MLINNIKTKVKIETKCIPQNEPSYTTISFVAESNTIAYPYSQVSIHSLLECLYLTPIERRKYSKQQSGAIFRVTTKEELQNRPNQRRKRR